MDLTLIKFCQRYCLINRTSGHGLNTALPIIRDLYIFNLWTMYACKYDHGRYVANNPGEHNSIKYQMVGPVAVIHISHMKVVIDVHSMASTLFHAFRLMVVGTVTEMLSSIRLRLLSKSTCLRANDRDLVSLE